MDGRLRVLVKERPAETSKHRSDSACGEHQGRVCRITGRSGNAVSDSKHRGATYLVLVLVLDLDKLEVPPGEASTLWKHMALVSTLWLASHQGSVWLERLSRPDEVTGL